MNKTIVITEHIEAVPERVWEAWTEPKHIMGWNFAADTWECPRAENDLRTGGKFSFRMSAKDGSSGFDLEGTYDSVEFFQRLSYTMTDGRKVDVLFTPDKNGTMITEMFEMETENSEEKQREGWRAILSNFKKYTEGLGP